MGEGFRNSILGGASTLVRPAIKSPNYAPGVAGWSINIDGTAEFNNITARGDVLADELAVPTTVGPFVAGYLVTANSAKIPAELIAHYGFGGTTGIHAAQISFTENGSYSYICVLGSDEVRAGWVTVAGVVLETSVWDWATAGGGTTRVKYMGNSGLTEISIGANADQVLLDINNVAGRLNLGELGTTSHDLWYDPAPDKLTFRSDLAQNVALGPLVNQRTTASALINSTTLATLCTVTLPNVGTYYWELDGSLIGDAVASSVGFGLQGTCTASAWRWTGGLLIPPAGASAATWANASGTTLPAATGGTTVGNKDVATAQIGFRITGTLTITAVGTLIAAMSRTVGTGTFTVQPGTIFRVEQIS